MPNLTLPTLTRRSLLSGLAASTAFTVSGAVAPLRMLVCGGSVVYDAVLAGSERNPHWEEIREWRPGESKGLPASHAAKLFQTTDDCKPIDGGTSVLVTSSAGGVAIYERASLATKFYARVPNAHSACMLPGGYLVVASSVSAEGNALVLFHRSTSERTVFRTRLESAHGVVWDEKRSTLYAVGMDHLEEYSFSHGNGTAELKLAHRGNLPTRGGHELSPGATEKELIVTTRHGVYVFDKAARSFSPHPVLGPDLDVKCVSLHPATGRTAYVKADEGKSVWWSFRIRFLHPEGSVESPGQRVYKARWG